MSSSSADHDVNYLKNHQKLKSTSQVIEVGSLLSTFGAGLQSLTGAPRLLQSIAKVTMMILTMILTMRVTSIMMMMIVMMMILMMFPQSTTKVKYFFSHHNLIFIKEITQRKNFLVFSSTLKQRLICH